MSILTITTKGPYREGQQVMIRGCIRNDKYVSHWFGIVACAEPYKVAVKVADRLLVFRY